MSKKELKKRIVRTVRESEEIWYELGKSVDPASPEGRSLKNVQCFLEQIEKTMTEEVARHTGKSVASTGANFFRTMLLKPTISLLTELWAIAVMAVSNLLWRS